MASARLLVRKSPYWWLFSLRLNWSFMLICGSQWTAANCEYLNCNRCWCWYQNEQNMNGWIALNYKIKSSIECGFIIVFELLRKSSGGALDISSWNVTYSSVVYEHMRILLQKNTKSHEWLHWKPWGNRFSNLLHDVVKLDLQIFTYVICNCISLAYM